MFAQIEYPDSLLPDELDNYLAQGWFRMRQTIFTTNFLHFNHGFYSAIWLRVPLEAPILDKKYLSLKKLNKGFKTEISGPAGNGISARHEALYQNYRRSLSFEVSHSLRELLYGNETNNRFSTYEVNIYDGLELIATGFFDMGKKSAAGISCIYHPAYKKYSLGKYLMYLKMDFCRQQELNYFYPGYVVPGYPSFDYKLELGKNSLQYLQLSTRQWLPYIAQDLALNPLKEMVEKLSLLQNYFTGYNISHGLMYYKFFEVNLDPYYYGHELFDFPVFINCFPAPESTVHTMIVYDVRDAGYHLLECSSVINIGFQQNGNTVFDSDLLKIEKQSFTSKIALEMAAYLQAQQKNIP